MLQLWEPSNTISADCDRGANDEPFFIPVTRRDIIQLRLIVPYAYVSLNGGGIPTGTGVELEAVNESGVTQLCNYTDASAGKFLYSYRNDSTNRIAEYQFLFNLGMADESGENYSLYSIAVTDGDVVKLDTTNEVYLFTYGVDDLPAGMIEYKAGVLAIVLTGYEYTNLTLEINGVADTVSALATTPACANESGACFRFKVTLGMVTLGQDLEYYTKPFRVIDCDDQTVLMESTFPAGMIDCTGHIHEGAGDDQYKNRHYLRVPAEVERLPSRIVKSYNSRMYSYKTERQEQFRLISEPMPQWFADAVETLLTGQEVRIDGAEYYQEGTDRFFEENNDRQGSKYINLNINLQSSKCEKVFVCQ